MSQKRTPPELAALQRAVAAAAGQAPLARKVNEHLDSIESRLPRITQAHIWNWLNRAKRTSSAYTLAVEAVTKESRHMLRPDIYPATGTVRAVARAEARPE